MIRFKFPFTQNHIAYILANYANENTAKMAAHIGCTKGQLHSKANILGVKKSANFHKTSNSGQIKRGQRIGKSTEFTPGFVPKNKGKKLEEYMSPQGIENSKKTRFKKGIVPHNTKYDGAITIRHHKQGNVDLKFIRIRKAYWVPLHQHLYRQAHGYIPARHVVYFKDGNTMNCELENLGILSLEEHMLRNTIHRFPPEVKDMIYTLSKLNRKIKKCQE